jgi:hypothetical protein
MPGVSVRKIMVWPSGRAREAIVSAGLVLAMAIGLAFF